MQGKRMTATASLESGKAMPSAELREDMTCCSNLHVMRVLLNCRLRTGQHCSMHRGRLGQE